MKDLCPLAPNNVNTMACAAIAAHNLGFDGVVGCLVADPRLTLPPPTLPSTCVSLWFSFSDASPPPPPHLLSLTTHVIEIEVAGPGDSTEQFAVHTVRTNPASSGVVTGKLTYASFMSSLLGKDTFKVRFPSNITCLILPGAHGRGCGVHLC